MRLIDAEKLKSDVKNARWIAPEDEGEARMLIDNQMTVNAEPVVHCKDCKYLDTYYCALRKMDDDVEPLEPEDFCSYGERK